MLQQESANDEVSLWRRWREQGDPLARAELLRRHQEYAYVLAAKLFRGRYSDEFEFADYLQFATVGLLEAMETFEPGREAKFRTFSSHRIRGAVLDGLNTMSERQQQVGARKRLREERAESLQAGKPGRDSTFVELAEVAIGLALGYMLEDTTLFQDGEAAVVESGYQRLELRQLQQQVMALVKELPPRERLVISAHYWRQTPFVDIAAELGVSKMRVSQLHRQALDRLHRMVCAIRTAELSW